MANAPRRGALAIPGPISFAKKRGLKGRPSFNELPNPDTPAKLHHFRGKTGMTSQGVKLHCLWKTLQSTESKQEKVFPLEIGLNIPEEYAFNHMGRVRPVVAARPPCGSPFEGRARPLAAPFSSAGFYAAPFLGQNWDGLEWSQAPLSVENAAIDRIKTRRSFSPIVRA